MTLRLVRFGVLPLAIAVASCSNTISSGPGDDGVGATGAGPAKGGSTGVGGSSSGASGSSGSSAGGTSGTGAGPATGGFGGTSGSSNAGEGINLQGAPAYFRFVRLTNEQWTNSVQSVLRLTAAPTFAEAFQNAVSGTTDFTNNELVLGVDSRGWSDYQAAAESLATQITSDAAQLRALYSGTDAAGFISTVGRRIYRRPLTQAETAAYQQLYAKGPTTLSGTRSDFAKGVSMVLEAMLQSPHFLYRVETGPADAPLSGYEIAAKLSLWLRNTTPDDALLDQAAGTGLSTADGVAQLADKMLSEAAAKTVMRNFHSEFLHFKRFAELSKVGVANYDPAINAELSESSNLFFDRIFNQGLGVKDIFLSTTGFVGAKMAALYGGGAAPASGLMERDLGASRPGYFLQLPFLMLNAHNADRDSIHRGVSMSLDVLCAPLPPPPADLVIPPLPTRMPGETNRDVVDRHTGECGAACHNLMINPLGFAFENFDGMGQYRDMEVNGAESLPIDASGSFDFVDGTKTWNNATEFMNVLASDPQTHLCYAKKLAGYGLQRDMITSDLPLLNELAAVSTSGSLKQVIVALVKQNAFRMRVGGVQ